MKSFLLGKSGVIIVGLFLLLIPAIIQAQSLDAPQGSPPIEQPLVREGTLAVRLAHAFGLSTANSEAEAETWLGEKGISPRNGWIADYPVTPDIVGELRTTVGDAADARKIPVNRDEAIKRLESITAGLALAIKPEDDDATPPVVGEGSDYVAPAVVNNYYYEEGPPVVTYYAPPADFYYLYSWVPYPFWYSGFWFGGFFILNDFHRSVFIGHNHHRAFVSNHFRGDRGFSRVDPVTRFNGRSGFNKGAVIRSNSVPEGGRGSRGTGFTAPRTPITSGVRQVSGGRQTASQPSGSGRTFTPITRGNSAPAQSYNARVSYTSSPGYRTQSRSYNAPSRSVSPAHSYEPSRRYTPSSNYMPASRVNTMSGNAFRGSGSFSGRYGRR